MNIKVVSNPSINLEHISIQHTLLDVDLFNQIGLCIYNSDESCESILHKDFPNLHSHHKWMNVYLHTPELLGLFLTDWQKLLLHKGILPITSEEL